MRKKAIIVSGYFNPLHKGHIEYLKMAKENGDLLFVIVNNDVQREIKGSKLFMLEDERITIINELRVVDKVFLSVDIDRTVSKTLAQIHNKYASNLNLCFANGGDQNNNSSHEVPVCKNLGIKLLDGLGDKIQSSSWILKKK